MYRFACVLLLCVSSLQAATFRDCGSKVGHFTSITVSDCDASKSTCVLKRNTNATIGINFTVDKDTTAVKSFVHGVLSGVPIPFPIAHPDACTDKDSGIQCPLAKDGGPYNFQATLFVEKVYPKLSLEVRWELKDENSEDIVCVEIPAKIQ